MAEKIEAAFGDVSGKTIAVLGLTFKPNTDDMREAPSLSIVLSLLDAGATITAYDPEGMEQAKALMEGVTFAADPYEAAKGADAVVLITEWDVLRALDLKRIAAGMAQPNFIDLRNVYPPEDVEEAGLRWYGVGRPARKI
jgi:UDPglucose 6-dehydrogenase